MNETKILLTVTHNKPLPPGAMDWLSGWMDGYLVNVDEDASVAVSRANRLGVPAGVPLLEEEWKPYPPNPWYEVSTHGRVRSVTRTIQAGKAVFVKKGRVLVAHSLPSGHCHVNLYFPGGKRPAVYVHRAVLETFVGPAPESRPCALHGNGIPTDNRLENLRWGSKLENSGDMVAHGTRGMGETASQARLTTEAVLAIRADSRRAVEISDTYGISVSHVNRIKAGLTWQHLFQPEDAIARK